jgi:Domain of unknown function (DUF4145)
MTKLFEKRFTELSDQIARIESTKQIKHDKYDGTQYTEVDSESFLSWCVKARNLISNACREDSQHFKAFEKAEEVQSYQNNYDTLKRVKAVFSATKEDYEGGYITSVKKLVQAEVFDSELEQATELATAGYAAAAAVIAGAVLETTLRSLCDANSIEQGKLDKMNADLAKAGVHNVLVQKKITALAAIRNSAAHGKSNEFTKDDVMHMIVEVNRYVSNSLS